MSNRSFRLGAVLFALAVSSPSQSLPDTLKRGEKVFENSCGTGYCHGAKGAPGGAPRLAARGLAQTYISTTVSHGISGSGMPSFSANLSAADLVAVVAYVATLNGVAEPDITVGRQTATRSGPVLTGEAARGQQLFREEVRGFGRCSTCHESGGLGIPVTPDIARVPNSVADLKALATPEVRTVTEDGEAAPALVISDGRQSTVFYDLTSAPPVLRYVEPGSVKFTNASSWRHSSVIEGYNDSDLAAILSFLRAVIARHDDNH